MKLVKDRRNSRGLFRHGRLYYRLVMVLLLVTVPVLVVPGIYNGVQGIQLSSSDIQKKFEVVSLSIASSTSIWLDFNIKALQQVVQQKEIVDMDPMAQKRVLEDMTVLYPEIYVASTTDLSGMNVARSDDLENIDYSDQYWFQAIKDGSSLAFQTIIDQASRKPALVIAVPILNTSRQVVGVGMVVAGLDMLSEQLQITRFGETGSIYVIDDQNYIVAHSDEEIASQLLDASHYPAVEMLREGYVKRIPFDEDGVSWLSYLKPLENGWGVIIQQQRDEMNENIIQMRKRGAIIFSVGMFLLVVAVTLIVSRVIRPIDELTATAVAIAGGDLESYVDIKSKDEIGVLAQAFNQMTNQLRLSQVDLKRQVTERTAELAARTMELETRTEELKERSSYLQIAAEVSRFVSSILEPDILMNQVVDLIGERFDLYYVGLFLVDAKREYARLKAGTGDAGKAMLERGHSVELGVGMVGWCIENAQPRIALQADADDVRLSVPDLPETRSEAALPLRSRDTVIGALSIQCRLSNAFDDENITIFQLLADQVAVAIDNARLYSESQETLQSLREVYAQRSRDSWVNLLQSHTGLAYRSDIQGAERAQNIWYPEMEAALKQGDIVITDQAVDDIFHPLAIPIKVRGSVVGVLDARKAKPDGDWLPEEITLLQTVVEQLGVALESAQLYQQTQNRAERERMVAEITGKLRASNDPQEILQTAAQELRQALGAKDARVLLRSIRASDDTPSGDRLQSKQSTKKTLGGVDSQNVPETTSLENESVVDSDASVSEDEKT